MRWIPFKQPTIRGKLALSFAVLGGLLFSLFMPDQYLVSNGNPYLIRPVSLLQWVFGGSIIFSSFATAMEAFRRGSQADRVWAGVALLLGIFLLRDYCNFLLIPSHPSSRHMHPYLHGGLLNNAGEILWIVVNLPSITVMGWVYRIFYLGSPGLIGTLTAVTTVTQWLMYSELALRFVSKRISK